MFLDPDGQRPLLYSKLLAQFQELQTRVGVPADELCGPHGLRVEGFNGTKAGLGVDLAVAQGLWSSAAHKRYDRFAMAQVVRIPAVIAGVDEGDDPAPVTERPAGPPPRRRRRGAAAGPRRRRRIRDTAPRRRRGGAAAPPRRRRGAADTGRNR